MESDKNVEMINLLELESNKVNQNQLTCPKCSHDSVIKKNYHVDIPKAMGFIFFLGASFVMVLIINAIVMIRQRMKINKLPKELKDQVNNENNKMSILGLHVPTKTKIECSRCHYIFYENYDAGDLVVVIGFFFFVLLFVGVIVFLFIKFK